MAADGTYNAEITAETKGFEGPIKRVINKIFGLSRSMSGLSSPMGAVSGGLGKLGGMMAGLVTAGAGMAGIVGGIAGLKKAAGAAMEVETLGVALEVFTGSADKAQGMMASLREMGATTSYDFPGLAEGATTMMQFGVATEDVMPTLRHLGEIAGGSNEKMKSLSLVWGQLASTGRLTGGDLMQLINAGFNPLLEISQKTGESMEKLKERMEKGGVSFSEVQKALVGATTEGGRFFGLMDKQSQTTAGLLSSLQDGLNAIWATLGEPINDALRPLLQDAISVVENMGMGMQAVIEIARSAFGSGQLGTMVGMSLKLGAMEGGNYLVGALTYAAEVFGRMFSVAWDRLVRLFTGGFNDVLTGLGSGMLLTLAGIGDVIRANIGGPFNQVVAHFQAGLMWAIEKAMEGLGKIPAVGKWLGLDGFTGASFSELLEDMLGASDPEALKATGKAAIADGLAAMGGAISSGADVMWDDLQGAFAGMDGFRPADIFDTSGLSQGLTNMAQSLNPEAFAKLQAALSGSGGQIKNATDHAALKIREGAAATASVTGGNQEGGGGETEGKSKRKIRLYGLAESEERRLARMSKADQEKYARGTRVGAANASPSLLGAASRLGGAGLRDAASAATSAVSDGLTPPSRRSRQAETQRGPEVAMLEALREISANTAGLKGLAAA